MGLFTEVTCADGVTVQFKTDWDQMQLLNIGDVFVEGEAADGIYSACWNDSKGVLQEDRFVVIIDGRVAAVIPADVAEPAWKAFKATEKKWLRSLVETPHCG